jgi:hypothetical protein
LIQNFWDSWKKLCSFREFMSLQLTFVISKKIKIRWSEISWVRKTRCSFQQVMVHIFHDTFCNMRTGVIGMDDHLVMIAYIPKSSNLRKNIIWIISACPLDSFGWRLYQAESVEILYDCNHYFWFAVACFGKDGGSSSYGSQVRSKWFENKIRLRPV